MKNLLTLFRSKEKTTLLDFSEKVERFRPRLKEMSPKETLRLLIEVAKVWTYDYAERRPFMDEILGHLPEKTRASFISFLAPSLPGWDVSEDIPRAICQLKKEKLSEFNI